MTVMKQLEVQIMGQSYLLACPEGGEQRLLEAVLRVDTAMCKIRDAGKVKARDRIAVLAALNLAFDPASRPSGDNLNAPLVASDLPVQGKKLSNGADPQDDARLSALLARLDQALGEDGRLL